jgi:hypothetical protein
MRLTLLAQDLVEAILDGQEPQGATLPGLMKPASAQLVGLSSRQGMKKNGGP